MGVAEVAVSAILSDPHRDHYACSWQEYVMEKNSNGKSVPKKVGLKPIQRDGRIWEYEFTGRFRYIGMDHQFIVSKDRTRDLFADGVVARWIGADRYGYPRMALR